MKNRLLASVALAAAIGLGASTANAGTFTALVAPAGTYAAEGISASTAVTAPTVVYNMGVGRAISQNFTVIVDFPAADLLVCGTPPVLTGSAGFTVTLKRCSAAQVAFDVTVTAATIPGATLTLTGIVFSATNLNVAGNTITETWSLKDPGETSFIDNVGTVQITVATSLNTITIANPGAIDTGTTTDVNNANGPLFGFVVQNDDTAFNAKATLTLNNNTLLANKPDNSGPFDFTATAGTASVSISDTAGFSGLATNQFCLDVDNDAVLCEVGEVLAVTGSGPATLTIPAASFPAVGTSRAAKSTFQATGAVSLGTGRSFSLSGTVNPAVGAQHAFSGANNSPYWTWTANATVLQSPWMSTFNASGYVNRFFLMNTGAVAVGFTATCLVEAGNTSTAGTTSGTIPGNGIVALNASSVCTFSGASRGAVQFVINSPAAAIKGTFQQQTPQAQVTDKPLQRVYAGPTF